MANSHSIPDPDRELETFAEQADYAVVGPTDNRAQVGSTEHFPFNTVCHLARDFGDGRLRGCSGVLVTPTTVLTAAHCLLNLLTGMRPYRILVSPGRRDRDSLPFGFRLASRAYVASGFVSANGNGPSSISANDYGLVTITQPFEALSRFMTLRAPTNADLWAIQQAGLITITGYPGDRPIGTLWRHSERLKAWTHRRLFYTVQTCPGHSGSPVWYRTAPRYDPIIIGLHTSGIVDEQGRAYGCGKWSVTAPSGSLNSGIRITPKLIEDIQELERRVTTTRLIRVL